MPYLIDGHNLIPKIPGLSLRAIDDEMQLIDLLQEFCRRRGKQQIVVFFDKAPPGGRRVRVFGAVTARFVSEGSTADAAIMKRLADLGRAARNWTVVSSDRQVIAAARSKHAASMSSEDFGSMLTNTLSDATNQDSSDTDIDISAEELDEWLQLFGGDDE